MKQIIINTKTFIISDKIVECSPFLSTCFEQDDTLTIDNFSDTIVELAMQIIKRYEIDDFGTLNSDFVPIKFKKSSTLEQLEISDYHISQWYINFFKSLTLSTIADIALFLDYLYIQPLYHLCAIYISSLVNEMNPEDRFTALLPITVSVHREYLYGETPDNLFQNLLKGGIDFDTAEKYKYHYNEVIKYIPK